jgi:hypothetical protein
VAIRDKIAANAQPHLQEGEQVQAVMSAQTQSQYWVLLAYVAFFIMNEYRTIVVTDRRIVVFDAGKLSSTKANRVVAELPRSTHLGPPSGTLWHKLPVGSEELRIHKRFFKDIDQADDQAR